MNIIIFLIILLVLVIVHEFGHFFTAKKFGIRVDEFGFGFPPKLFSRKYGETEYSLNALPFGGFVKIFGDNPDAFSDPDTDDGGLNEDRKFYNKPKWQQAIVLFAGVFANFVLAWLLFSFGLMSGMPTSVSSDLRGAQLENVHLVVISVFKDSPASRAGLMPGDKILSIKSGEDSVLDVNPETLKSFVVSHGGKEIELEYKRGTEENVAKVVPKAPDTGGDPSIGISMDQIGTAKLPVLQAFWEGLKLDIAVTKGTVVGLFGLIADAFQGKGSFASVTGPVGMVGIVGEASKFGFGYLMSFAALISVNLAIINLLPFPALDGGRLFFLLVEKIKGSRINPKFANAANMTGFALLILLMVVITYHDVVKLF